MRNKVMVSISIGDHVRYNVEDYEKTRSLLNAAMEDLMTSDHWPAATEQNLDAERLNLLVKKLVMNCFKQTDPGKEEYLDFDIVWVHNENRPIICMEFDMDTIAKADQQFVQHLPTNTMPYVH